MLSKLTGGIMKLSEKAKRNLSGVALIAALLTIDVVLIGGVSALPEFFGKVKAGQCNGNGFGIDYFGGGQTIKG
jgi:hypothetical protein